MTNFEEEIVDMLSQQMANAIDEQLLIDVKYYDYKKINVPGWIYHNNRINDWVIETLPACAFINSTFYYKSDADALLFRLKWL